MPSDASLVLTTPNLAKAKNRPRRLLGSFVAVKLIGNYIDEP